MDHFLNLISGRHSLYKNVFVVFNIISYIVSFSLFFGPHQLQEKHKKNTCLFSWELMVKCVCLLFGAGSQFTGG